MLKEQPNWLRPGIRILCARAGGRREWLVIGRCSASGEWVLERVGKCAPSQQRRTITQHRADRFWIESTT